MKFSIYDDPTAGSRLWTECGTVGTPTARTVAVANGVFSVMLGDTASGACPGPAGANAITLDFNSDSYYLGFTMESDSEMLPRKRLGASGYAFNADLLDGLNTSAAGGSNAFVPVTDSSGHLTLTQNLTLGGVMKASDGAVGAPSYTFTNDLDTGLYYSATQINIGVGGSAVANVSASGLAVDTVKTLTATTLTLKGTVADGGTAVGATIGSNSTLSTAGAKLASFVNNITEKAAIGLNGEILAGAGTNLLPSLSFLGDPNTGIYNTSSDRMDFVAGGTAQVAITAGTLYFDNMRAFNAVNLGLRGAIADGASAIGTKVGNATALTVAGAKIISFYNDNWTTEKAYIDKDGNFYGPGANFSGLSVSSAVYTDGSKNLTSTAPTSGALGYWSRATTTLSPTTANDIVAVTGNSGDLLTLTSTATGADRIYGTATDATAVANYGGYFTAAGTGTNTTGVYGSATATGAVSNFGGDFFAAGNSGQAVRGQATATGAVTNYGGVFYAAGNTGFGIVADATSTNAGQNFGGYFYARGTTGVAVYGNATATGAVTNYGGSFVAAGNTGQAVRGNASATGAAANIGGAFYSSGNSGAAVYGSALATGAVTNYGGQFYSAGDTGIGVFGYASSASGLNYGVYGATVSATGWSGYFSGGLGLYASAARINSLSASSSVYTDASKNLTSTAPTSGAIGYWSRSSTTLSTATAADTVSLTGGLNLGGSPITNAYIAINPWSTGNIGSANGLGLQMNRLLGSNTGRHTVTTSGFSGGTSYLYDSFYDVPATIPYGGTGVVTVDFNPQMGWTDNTSTPSFIYQNGMIVMSFYYTYLPTNVTVEMYHYNSVSLVDEWTTIYNTTSNNQDPLIINPTPSINYIKKIRFTFSGGGDPGLGILISELEWFPTCESSANELAVIPKYYSQNMDVSWTNLNMKSVSDWSTTATISNAGAAYFAGNVGVNNSGPDRKLESLDASNPQLRLTHTDNSVYTDFKTNSDGDLYIAPSGGDVGIGATTPQSTLDLGNGTGGRSIVWGGSTGTGHFASIGTAYSTSSLSLANMLKLSTTADQYLVSYTGVYPHMGFRLNAGNGDFSFFTEAATNRTVGDIFDYAAATKVTIKADGKVGIGDTTPAALFTVGNTDLFQVNSSGAIAAAAGIISSGTIQFTGLTASSAVYTDGSKNLTSTAPTSGALGYWSRATTTLSPTTANDIVAVTGNSGDLLTLTSTATGADNKALNIAASGATTGTDYGAYISNTGAGTTNVGLYATASGAVTNNYAAVFAAGNVGIGTASPTAKLHIYGSSYTGAIFQDTTASAFGYNQFSGPAGISYQYWFGNTWSSGVNRYVTSSFLIDVATSGGLGLAASDASGAIRFYTGGDNERMRILSGGNVGIGDTTPAALFTVGNTDLFQVNSSGAIAAAAGIISSGTIQFTGLTASSAVYTDASKNLTSTAPATGTIGYWSRTGTTLSPATANDVVSVSGTGATAITGTSSAAGGTGVSGTATDATAVANYGGYFTAAGTIGYSAGVYGEASGASNLALGVHGVASATGAYIHFGGA
ncbi:MAG: hypothetical protein WC778_11465, partial [Negativicutes bacterium]